MSSQRHIFLSPHSVDAVWSCGGEIARLVGLGVAVVVVTVFDGDGLHPVGTTTPGEGSNWRRTDWAMRRRAENARAAELLGFEHQSIGMLDAVNRFDTMGCPLYPTAASMLGVIHEDDDSLRTVLALRIGELVQHGDTLYSPHGISTHVDHTLVSAAASMVRPLHFRFHEFRFHQSVTPAFDECELDHLRTWVAAGLSYTGQVRALFGGRRGFEEAVRRFSGHTQAISVGD